MDGLYALFPSSWLGLQSSCVHVSLNCFRQSFRRKVPCINMTDKRIEDLFRQMQEMWLVQGQLQQTLQAQLELQQHLQMNLVGMQIQHHQLQLQHQHTLGVITELHKLLKNRMVCVHYPYSHITGPIFVNSFINLYI